MNLSSIILAKKSIRFDIECYENNFYSIIITLHLTLVYLQPCVKKPVKLYSNNYI